MLDLRDPVDQALARELAIRADVVGENFRSGSLDEYGLGYEQVRKTNEGMVYCSITRFGSALGAGLPGYDFIVQAVGGLMSINGESDESGCEPMKAGVALVDVLTSKDATAGILAALYARGRSGTGQRVEGYLLSSVLAALVNQASAYLATGDPPGRMGNAHPSIAPNDLLTCADATLAIACGNGGQSRDLARVLGDESLGGDEPFSSIAARACNRPMLLLALNGLLAHETADVWVKRLTDAGVPAGKVGSIADAFALAEALGLDPLVDVGADKPAQVRHP